MLEVYRGCSAFRDTLYIMEFVVDDDSGGGGARGLKRKLDYRRSVTRYWYTSKRPKTYLLAEIDGGLVASRYERRFYTYDAEGDEV